MSPWKERRVLVTGANGFLGRAVSAAAVANGAMVRGLVRRPGVPLAAGVEPVLVGGLDDLAGLRRACSGMDTLVHFAARVHQSGGSGSDPEARFTRDNVLGTGTLLDAGRDAGVATVVLASSVKAVADREDVPLDESAVPHPADSYGRSKLAAEGLVRDWAGTGRRAVVVRLPLVYGPGMRGNMLRLFRAVFRGIPLPLSSISNQRSVLASSNLTRIVAAVLDGADGSHLYHAADPDPISTPDLVRGIAAALGTRARLFSCPPRLLLLLGRSARSLVGSLVLDSARLRGDYPELVLQSTSTALQETARWFLNSARAA